MLPVNLVPTAMAGEMRSGWPHATPTAPARDASFASTDRSGEIAEVIGQEELPLQAALASARSDAGQSSTFAWSPATKAIDEHDLQTASDEPEDGLPIEAATTSAPTTVAIETRVVPGRPGRPPKPEKFPFGALTPASPNENGDPCGPCFLIPVEDNPERCVAAALKRHRPKKFITRKVPGGTWVWRRS